MRDGPTHTPGTVWAPGRVTVPRRFAALGHEGVTVWLTGLPASGKSTIAAALEERLVGLARPALRLDGDNLRHGLNADLGFSPSDRDENVRRTAHVAALLAQAGVVSIVALVSPYAAARREARNIHDQADVRFHEVFVDTPLDECMRRDPKGLYRRSRAGELIGLTGVDDPYEPPTAPDLVVCPGPLERALDDLLVLVRSSHSG